MAPHLRWWTRFRTWPRWTQAGIWVVLAPLPLMLLAADRRRWLVRAVAALVAGMWFATAVVLVMGLGPSVIRFIGDRPPRLWIEWLSL